MKSLFAFMVGCVATFACMAKNNGGILLLRFDDRNFPAWERALPLFEKYGAHATFFIYGAIDDQAVATMRKLKAAGHSLGAHGLKHRLAVDAMKKLGEREYLEQELRPQLVAAKNAGVPLYHFGYPCSQRDERSDALLLTRFDRIVGGGYWKEAKAGSIDRCDELFVPVAEASRRRVWIGASVGTCAPSITGEMARVVHRLAHRGEAALFYTHNIVDKSPHGANDVSFRELEFLLRTAREAGVRVCGLDDLGGEVLDLNGCFPPEIRTVGVVMPASILAKPKFDRGVAALRAAGYRVKLAPRLSFGKLASVEDRTRDFEEMWMDPEVDLLLCARGGTGAQDVIQRLDWAKLRTRDQRVLGFSNITMILNAMLKEQAGHPFSGPTISQLNYAKGDTLAWLSRAVAGAPQPSVKLRAIRPGAFRGLPCGGHTALVKLGIDMKMTGSAVGRVVVLERNPSTGVEGIRSELDAIAASGWLKGCVGIVFGDVTPGSGDKTKSRAQQKLAGAQLKDARAEVEAIKRAFAEKVDCPVYDGLQYGHISVSHALDFRREISVAEDGTMNWL